MTPDELKRQFPNASAGFIAANCPDGIQASGRERAPKCSLERPASGQKESRAVPQGRAFVRFDFYSVRPLDADNNHIKGLLDCLVIAGLIPEDGWRQLAGVAKYTHKVHQKRLERTEILITVL